jgi:hypothetical protein
MASLEEYAMTLINRRFILKSAAVALALPFIGAALAQALKKLPPDNATAKALKYVENAAGNKEPGFKPGSECANCQFFTASNGACTLFSGFSVAPQGWCTAWAKKA